MYHISPLARSSDLVLVERKEAGGGRPAKSPSFMEKEPKARSRQLGIVDKGPDPHLNASSAYISALLPEHGVFLLSASTSSLVK